MNDRLICAIAIGFVVGAPVLASAETYYVAPKGNDRGNGSEKSPWQTPAHAVKQLRPGDTLIVRPGRYESFTVHLQNSGTKEARVSIIGQKGAIIDRARGKARDMINIEHASYITIEGFEVTNASRAGIRAVECQHVHVRGNHAHDNGRWGIFTGFCDDLVIENNITSGSKREHGIYVSNSAKRPIIRGNRIFGNAGSGIHTNGDVNMGRDGMTVNALIEGNIIYDNGIRGGAGSNNDGMRDSIIRNNIFYDNLSNGITLYRIDGRKPSTGNRVVNNTIVMPEKTRWCIHIVDGSTGNVVKNNICVNKHSYRGGIEISADSLDGFVSDNNLIDARFTLNGGNSVLDLDQWRRQTGQDKTSVAITAENLNDLFVAPDRGDFRLLPGSIAIDRGDPAAAPDRDNAGHRRPVGAAPDIGALEYCQGSSGPLACRRIGAKGAGQIGAKAAATIGAGSDDTRRVAGGSSHKGEPPTLSPVARPKAAGGSGCCKGQVNNRAPGWATICALIVLLTLHRRR